MTAKETAGVLIETVAGLPVKLRAAADRIILRIYSSPALLTALSEVAVLGDGEAEPVRLQLKFFRLPDVILPQVEQLIGQSCKMFKFDQGHRSYHAFEVPLSQPTA